ncbi:MAG: peptidylprolyl isomerase [Nitrospirae bacterium]|nr:peptidylprolyl isomerase [Nitrospirota bacterium]
MKAFFLERLIDMKLQLQAAKQLGIDATSEDVNEAVSDIKKKYSMDDAALTESLKKEGFTFDEYKKKIGEQIILSRVVSQQVRNKLVVSDSDIDKELSENKADVTDEAYRIRQIFFRKPDANITKGTLEEKADMILRQLKAGEDFSVLAKIYSEDQSSKTGGDLGLIKKGYLAKEFVDVLGMMKVGDFSPAFWTDKGLHIIKLEERFEKQSEAGLRSALKNKLFEKLFEERYKSWLRGLRENAYIEIRL